MRASSARSRQMLDESHVLWPFRCRHPAPTRPCSQASVVASFGRIADTRMHCRWLPYSTKSIAWKTRASPTTADVRTRTQHGAASRQFPFVPQRRVLLHSRFVNPEAYRSAEKATGYRSWMSALRRSCWRPRCSTEPTPMQRFVQTRYPRVSGQTSKESTMLAGA
jgi:hypothetical protein